MGMSTYCVNYPRVPQKVPRVTCYLLPKWNPYSMSTFKGLPPGALEQESGIPQWLCGDASVTLWPFLARFSEEQVVIVRGLPIADSKGPIGISSTWAWRWNWTVDPRHRSCRKKMSVCASFFCVSLQGQHLLNFWTFMKFVQFCKCVVSQVRNGSCWVTDKFQRKNCGHWNYHQMIAAKKMGMQPWNMKTW